MDQNYHYYVTYSAARRAGYEKEEALKIAQSAQYVDQCPDTVQGLLSIFWENFKDWVRWELTNHDRKLEAEAVAIWAVFHFLPGDAQVNEEEMDGQLLADSTSDDYLKAHLICQPESRLSGLMVHEAKRAAEGGGIDALVRTGITMHVLADTFAHQSFAGVPSEKINKVDWITHNDLDKKDRMQTAYWRSPGLGDRSFGYMGHGQVSTWPDEPGETLSYSIAWRKTESKEIVRFNPLEFYCAYLKMIQAMKYIRGDAEDFSPLVNRAQLMDRRGDAWPETRQVMREFLRAGKDKNLLEYWKRYTDEIPKEYKKPEDDNEFRRQASLHREFVIDNCDYLRRYLERLQG